MYYKDGDILIIDMLDSEQRWIISQKEFYKTYELNYVNNKAIKKSICKPFMYLKKDKNILTTEG